MARGRQLLHESRPQVEPIITSHSIHKPQAQVVRVSYQELREILMGHISFSRLTHVVWVSSRICIDASQNPINTRTALKETRRSVRFKAIHGVIVCHSLLLADSSIVQYSEMTCPPATITLSSLASQPMH